MMVMNAQRTALRTLGGLLPAALAAVAVVAQESASILKAGSEFELGSRKAVVKKLDALPFVESEYTRRFRFDSFDNPKLKELRGRYRLDEVVAPGKDEFDRQVLLLDWTHRRFKRFGRPSAPAKGALEILKAIEEGHSFFCAQYAAVFVSSAAALGWVARPLALRRHQDAGRSGSTEHATTEIWSNMHSKWIMMDPTAKMYIEKDGSPLNAYEIRHEWFYREGRDLVFVVGKERKKYRKPDLPIFLGRFPGFGDLTVPADELDKYGFTAYIPNNNLMDEGPDYGKMFIVKDKLCDGTRWHQRTVPAEPAVDPYFPIGQAALALAPEGGRLRVEMRTMTPNFMRFDVRLDGGVWKASEETFRWDPHPGLNRLEARVVNRFGVEGPVSTVEVEIR